MWSSCLRLSLKATIVSLLCAVFALYVYFHSEKPPGQFESGPYDNAELVDAIKRLQEMVSAIQLQLKKASSDLEDVKASRNQMGHRISELEGKLRMLEADRSDIKQVVQDHQKSADTFLYVASMHPYTCIFILSIFIFLICIMKFLYRLLANRGHFTRLFHYRVLHSCSDFCSASLDDRDQAMEGPVHSPPGTL